MSIVIIGGHDRMVCVYKNICKEFNCKAKVFTQMPSDLRTMIGTPNLMVLFTNTVSHKMVQGALKAAEKNNVKIVRSHSSSCALRNILSNHCPMGDCENQNCPYCKTCNN
jgi:hypothetical protein